MKKLDSITAQEEFKKRYKKNNTYSINLENGKVIIPFSHMPYITVFDGKKWLTQKELDKQLSND